MRYLALVLLLVSVVGCNATNVSKQAEQPNIIFVFADDWGYGDLGCYGHKEVATPNLDNLASQGTLYTQFHVTGPVCSPSRTSVITGHFPARHRVHGHFAGNEPNARRGMPNWLDETLPVYLPRLMQEAGYKTAHFGKWHLSNFTEEMTEEKGRPQKFKNFGFSTDPNQPTMDDYGYDYWFATGNVARPCHKNPENFFLNGKAMGLMEGFSAQIVASELIKWLREHRDDNQPFFITLWFHEPHGPIESDPRFIERYNHVTDSSFQQYLANVTQIDEAVGQVVEVLKNEGIYDETLIWYTSDNGPEGPHEFGSFNNENHIGHPRYRGSTGGLRGRKRHTHEGGIRVPGIISWPAGFERNRIKPGGISAEPIIGSDVFPTFLEIAGIDLPENVTLDATSILPILENKEFQRIKPLYWRNNSHEFRIALRDGDWKIIAKADQTGFELYNLVVDPRETTDLSAHEPEIFERLKKALIEYDNEVLKEGPDWWKKGKNVKDMPEIN